MSRACPLCGRPVLCVGLTTCDACASRNVVAPAKPPTPTVRWSPLSEPVPCRECHRPFVRKRGNHKRCDDCVRDGIGGARHRAHEKETTC